MTISSGGFNVNFNPTPTIYERETTGSKDLQNAGDIGKGNVVISSKTDLIPFTKLDDRNKWNYKAEPERPALMPNNILRGSGAEVVNRDEGWRTQYERLYDRLPDDVKLQLAGLPTVYTAALKFVLDLAAHALNWQAKALLYTQTENALNRVNENLKFPDRTYGSSLRFGKELTKTLEKWVDAIGHNDPSYIESKEFLQIVRTLLKGTKTHDG